MSAPVKPSTRHVETPATETTGFAQCVTGGCEDWGALVEVPMVTDHVTIRATDFPITMTETAYSRPASDEALNCPTCGNPRAFMLEKPPTYRPFRSALG